MSVIYEVDRSNKGSIESVENIKNKTLKAIRDSIENVPTGSKQFGAFVDYVNYVDLFSKKLFLKQHPNIATESDVADNDSKLFSLNLKVLSIHTAIETRSQKSDVYKSASLSYQELIHNYMDGDNNPDDINGDIANLKRLIDDKRES